MEILEAYDLTGSYRAAAELASCEGLRFASDWWCCASLHPSGLASPGLLLTGATLIPEAALFFTPWPLPAPSP